MHAKTASPALALVLLAPCVAAAADLSGGVYGTLAAADSPFTVVGDVVVPPGTTLAIEPGCELLFMPGTGLVAEGTLDAAGTPARPIALVAHPSYNGIGQWDGVMLSGPGPHALDSVTVRRAATGVTVAGSATCDLTDTFVSESLGDGLVFDAGSSGSVLGGAFTGNGGAGIAVSDASPTIAGAAFTGNDTAMRLSGNAFPALSRLGGSRNVRHDGVLVDTLAPLTRTGQWFGCGLPYVIEDANQLQVTSSSVLYLGAGTVVKIGKASTIAVQGALVGLGTTAEPCILTSLLDDTVLGDTEQDGPTSPAKGDWSGVDVYPGATARLASTHLRHGDDGVRVLGGASVSLVGCEIGPTLFRGLAFGIGTNAYLEACVLHDNDVALYTADGVTLAASPGPLDPTAGRNVFTCNTSMDVVNESEEPIALGGNYWGDGPDPSRFTGLVDVPDWLTDGYESASERTLRVKRLGGADLVFWWQETSTCASHRVLAATEPDGLFAPLMQPTLAEWHVEQGGVYLSGRVVYFKLARGF